MEIEVNRARHNKGFWNFVRCLNGSNKTLHIKVEPYVLAQHFKSFLQQRGTLQLAASLFWSL